MKPMLAVAAPADIKFPVFASPKLDGIRAVVKDGVVLSRKMIAIPNEFVQRMLGHNVLNGLDGELTVGDANAPDVMQKTMSGVMTIEGMPMFTYWIFDFWTTPELPYGNRYQIMKRASDDGVFPPESRVRLLPQVLIHNDAELRVYERDMLDQGFEGVMIRDPKGEYKFGRSTARQGWLLKVKRFVDGEAIVIGFDEKLHNGNTATVGNDGHTKRSTNAEGMVPMDTLGALRVRDCKTGVEFGVGTGFDDAERQHIWQQRQAYLNKIIVYKHFEQVGVKDAPRFPVFKGFRDARDMS